MLQKQVHPGRSARLQRAKNFLPGAIEFLSGGKTNEFHQV
jgi:hypothetical protein